MKAGWSAVLDFLDGAYCNGSPAMANRALTLLNGATFVLSMA